jgi:hypothetical protein
MNRDAMLETAIPQDVLSTIAPDEQDSFKNNYACIAGSPGANCDLQQFLDVYLQHLVQLYAATGGAIWFREVGGRRVTPKVSLGYESLGLDGELASRHEALLQYAMTQTSSFLVKPFAAPESRSNASNPTDSFILLGPVDSQGDRIAVVELFLGPTPPRASTAAQRNRYVLWLDHLLGFFCEGLENRFLGNLAPLQPALVNLAATRAEIEAFKQAILVSLEVTLSSFAGWNFGSLANNRTFTRNVQELLDSNGLRVECPECGSPAILRCQSAGNSKTGVFLYDHYLDSGRTFHGGPTTFPRLKLVPKPPRRKSR